MAFQVKDGTVPDKLNPEIKMPFTAPRAASGCVVTNVRPVP